MEVLRAIEKSDIPALQQALQSSPDSVNQRNNEGLTPLLASAQAGNLPAVKALTTSGAPLNDTNQVIRLQQSGQSPLFLACWKGHIPIADHLLGLGAKVNTADKRGWSPLTISVFHNNFEAVRLLISHHAELEPKDMVRYMQFGKTPLDRAKDIAMIKLLQDALRQRRGHRPPARPRFDEPARPKRSLSSDKRFNVLKSDSVNVEERRQSRENIERLLKTKGEDLQRKLAENLDTKMKKILSNELNSAKQTLTTDLERSLARMSKDLFLKLKQMPQIPAMTTIPQNSESEVFKYLTDRLQETYDNLTEMTMRKISDYIEANREQMRDELTAEIKARGDIMQTTLINREEDHSFVRTEEAVDEYFSNSISADLEMIQSIVNPTHKELNLEFEEEIQYKVPVSQAQPQSPLALLSQGLSQREESSQGSAHRYVAKRPQSAQVSTSPLGTEKKIPRTNVASALQEFLRYEEKHK